MMCLFLGVEKSDAVYIYISMYALYILFRILFYYRLLQDIEYRSVCYTGGSYCLSVLCTVVCIC